jgi:gas vesicle protein
MTCNKSTYVPVFLAGVAAGAAVALLVSPKSGAATRHAIGRKAGEGTDLLKARMSSGRDYILECGAELRDRAKGAAERIALGGKPEKVPAQGPLTV